VSAHQRRKPPPALSLSCASPAHGCSSQPDGDRDSVLPPITPLFIFPIPFKTRPVTPISASPDCFCVLPPRYGETRGQGGGLHLWPHLPNRRSSRSPQARLFRLPTNGGNFAKVNEKLKNAVTPSRQPRRWPGHTVLLSTAIAKLDRNLPNAVTPFRTRNFQSPTRQRLPPRPAQNGILNSAIPKPGSQSPHNNSPPTFNYFPPSPLTHPLSMSYTKSRECP
jgi:hypothetical protein